MGPWSLIRAFIHCCNASSQINSSDSNAPALHFLFLSHVKECWIAYTFPLLFNIGSSLQFALQISPCSPSATNLSWVRFSVSSFTSLNSWSYSSSLGRAQSAPAAQPAEFVSSAPGTWPFQCSQRSMHFFFLTVVRAVDLRASFHQHSLFSHGDCCCCSILSGYQKKQNESPEKGRDFAVFCWCHSQTGSFENMKSY